MQECFTISGEWPFKPKCELLAGKNPAVLMCTLCSQFLGLFFPAVAQAQQGAKSQQKSAYCTFDDAGLQAWTSSMFIAGAVTGGYPVPDPVRSIACMSVSAPTGTFVPHS